MSETEFVAQLLADQPFIPKYFPFDVGVNKKGAAAYDKSISDVKIDTTFTEKELANLNPSTIIIDSRPQEQFKKGHLKNAINLMDDTKFETWLGSIVDPNEPFYLIAENEETLKQLVERTAKIGYEPQIEKAFVSDFGDVSMEIFNASELKSDERAYTLVDIRSHSESKEKPLFGNAINIPLHQLRERTNEIPKHKPIVVHCAGGYRSAAGSSLIKAALNGNTQVFDLSVAVKEFQV
jgi:rhodanese-related sulfurtransferase